MGATLQETFMTIYSNYTISSKTKTHIFPDLAKLAVSVSYKNSGVSASHGREKESTWQNSIARCCMIRGAELLISHLQCAGTVWSSAEGLE